MALTFSVTFGNCVSTNNYLKNKTTMNFHDSTMNRTQTSNSNSNCIYVEHINLTNEDKKAVQNLLKRGDNN